MGFISCACEEKTTGVLSYGPSLTFDPAPRSLSPRWTHRMKAGGGWVKILNTFPYESAAIHKSTYTDNSRKIVNYSK